MPCLFCMARRALALHGSLVQCVYVCVCVCLCAMPNPLASSANTALLI